MDDPGDRHPVFQLLVDDGVTTDDDRSGCVRPLGAALENLAEHLDVEAPFWKSDDVQGGDRVGTHRVDVAERVGRGNLSEHVGVVHDRREEVDGVDDGQVRAQTKHARIVRRLGADDHIGMIDARQLPQDEREIGGAELGRAAGGGHVLGQSRWVHERAWACRHHAVSVLGCRSLRTSPILIVRPVRSKNSSRGIAYLREVW